MLKGDVSITIEEMKQALLKIEDRPMPMLSFMDDKEIMQLYAQHFESVDSGDEDVDIVYEEVLTRLFGYIKGIEVNSPQTGIVKVSRSTLKSLYKPLQLKRKVFKAVVLAHNDVLEYGLETGNEMVIILDITTGKEIKRQVGSAHRVELDVREEYPVDLLTIHNHPGNTSFSFTDLFHYGIHKPTKYLVAQCHSGTIYYLCKKDAMKFLLTMCNLKELWDNIHHSSAYKNKSFVEKGEIFVSLVAGYQHWEFLRKG